MAKGAFILQTEDSLVDLAEILSPNGFLAAKIVTARFFAEQLLPEADLMLAQVTAGPDDLYAIASDALWMG